MNKEQASHWLGRISEFSFLGAFFCLPFSKAILEILLVVTFVSWLINKVIKNESFIEDQRVFLIAGIFLLSSGVSAFGSGYSDLSLRGMVKLLKYVLVMIVAVDLFHNRRMVNWLIVVIAASFSAVLLDAFYQQIVGTDLIVGFPVHYTDKQVRLTGPFSFYGLLGSYLIAFLPILLFVCSSAKSWKRIFFTVLSAAGLYLLYMTHSRGAWLAAFFSWLLFGIFMRKKLVIIPAIVAVLVLPFVLPRNTLIHFDAEQKEQSIIERFYLWDRAIQVIKEKPFFGCGINTYIHNYQKFDETKSWRVPGYYAHNGYLQLAAETGLISLLLFLSIIWQSLWAAHKAFWKSGKEHKPLIAGLTVGFLALLFQAFVDTTLHNLQSAVLIWFFMGLLIAVNKLEKE